jgi:hypothetical protein
MLAMAVIALVKAVKALVKDVNSACAKAVRVAIGSVVDPE